MLLLLPLLLPSPSPDEDRSEDVVELADGETLEGIVVYEDPEVIVLRKGSRDRELTRAEVARVDSRAGRQRDLLEIARSTPAWDPSANAGLARAAAAVQLPGEAALFWWRVLAADPTNDEAHEALGHRRRGERWVVPVGHGRVPLEELSAGPLDFGDAWELQTLHYRVRTNLDLRTALDLTLDLEQVYRGFFDLFAADLRLFEVVRRMEVHVHADSSSYPELGSERGYFDASDRIVRVDASAGYRRDGLVHEAVHQLLHFTGDVERAYSAAIPAWLDEGLAEYFAACAVGPPGRLQIEPGLVDDAHFRHHAVDDDPLKLTRVLTLNLGDFRASTGQAQKYAQSYTLVHFCLHAEGEAYRDGFLSYLRSAYTGKASSTAFRRILGKEEDELEEAWTRYVHEVSGL